MEKLAVLCADDV